MTRKIVVTEFMTLDGYMTGVDGDQSAFAGNWSGDLDTETLDQQSTVDAILLGRTAYEQMVAYWPDVTTEDDRMTTHMNETPKFVVSTTLKTAPWGSHEPATVIHDLTPQVLAELKSGSGGNIAVIGSASVVQQLEAMGQVDEYKVMLFPALLGHGTKLFATQPQRSLRLSRSHTLSHGVIVLHYST